MNSRYFDFKFLIGLFIIIVLVVVFYGQVSQHIYSLNYYYLFLGFLTLLLIISIKSTKWYLLLGAIKSWKLAFKSYFTGQFVNEIAPIGTGDLAKAYMLRKYSTRSFGTSLSIPYIERVLDIAVLSSLAILSSLFLFFVTISTYISLVFILVFVLSIGFFLLATFPVRMAEIVKKLLEFFRKIIRASFVENVISKLEIFILNTSMDFKKALATFKNRKLFIFSMLLMTIADWFLEGVCMVFLLNSLGYSIPVSVSVGIVSISWLVSIPSMIPGGLGIRETILSLLFSSWGVPFSVALVIVLIYRGLVILIFGSGSLISLKIRLAQ